MLNLFSEAIFPIWENNAASCSWADFWELHGNLLLSPGVRAYTDLTGPVSTRSGQLGSSASSNPVTAVCSWSSPAPPAWLSSRCLQPPERHRHNLSTQKTSKTSPPCLAEGRAESSMKIGRTWIPYFSPCTSTLFPETVLVGPRALLRTITSVSFLVSCSCLF